MYGLFEYIHVIKMEIGTILLIYVRLLVGIPGAVLIMDLLRDKLAAMKGKVKIFVVNTTGKMKTVGFGDPGSDGKVNIKGTLYHISREGLFHGKWGCPSAIFNNSIEQINIVSNETNPFMKKEMDNMFSEAYSLGVIAAKRDDKKIDMMLILIIILTAASVGVSWYFNQHNIEIFEIVKSLKLTI